MIRVIHGDILRFAAHYKGPKFHAVLCDPPYELGFMGRSWDSQGVSFQKETWAAINNLMLPGAHLMAFGGTRTFMRIGVAIEDGGFEIRDTLGWLYGQGFPKSHNVSKAIDKDLGAVREKIRVAPRNATSGTMYVSTDSRPWIEKSREVGYHELDDNNAVTEEAKTWTGYGTALKPAWEPIVLARKPIVGSVSQNCLAYSTGALAIDRSRVGDEVRTYSSSAVVGAGRERSVNVYDRGDGKTPEGSDAQKIIERQKRYAENRFHTTVSGRWPANILHDDSKEVRNVFPSTEKPERDDSFSASRFFYSPKASRKERDEGLESFELRPGGAMVGNLVSGQRKAGDGVTPIYTPQVKNFHPTVKPISLIQYLAGMIRPPDGIECRILIPFAGSGSEMIGAMLAGWTSVVGVEKEIDFVRIARARIDYYRSKSND